MGLRDMLGISTSERQISDMRVCDEQWAVNTFCLDGITVDGTNLVLARDHGVTRGCTTYLCFLYLM